MRRGAAVGEVVNDGVHGIELRRAVAPDVRPVRLALARLEHRHRRLVGVQHRTLEQHRPQRIDQRLQVHAASTDPLRQRRARYGQASPFEDAFLPIQRLVIGVLRHQHLGQQPRGRQALVDHLRRHRRLDQRLALRTGPFAANVALDMEHARGVVELLAHVLADALQRAAATAHGSLRLMAHFHPRQMRRQRATLGLLLRRLRRRRRSQRRKLRRDRFQIGIDRLIEQAALRAVQLFAARGKLPALEHRHLMRELLDLELLVLQLAILAGQCFDQVGGKFAQLLRIHPSKLIVHLHACR